MNNHHYKQRLEHLRHSHQALDKRIDGLEKTGVFEDQQLTELKRQRLTLKQQIADIESKIVPENFTKNS